MGYRATLNPLRAVEHGLDDRTGGPSPTLLATKIECLEQLLQAFRDIADHDDIHQAAHRLELVQAWIDNEAERAAADPIFADLQLV